jgi:hypothetical protein
MEMLHARLTFVFFVPSGYGRGGEINILKDTAYGEEV